MDHNLNYYLCHGNGYLTPIIEPKRNKKGKVLKNWQRCKFRN